MIFKFLCSTAAPFLRPDLAATTTSREAAVKDGRRSGFRLSPAAARPRLDGREHGVMLKGERASL